MTNSLKNQDQLLQERYAFKVTAHLSKSTEILPHDIAERLRIARMQALEQRKVVELRPARLMSLSGGGVAVAFGQGEFGWGRRFASAIPLVALVIGLVAINIQLSDNRAKEVAEVDAALLTDDLPPTAYTDPGFLQFLRVNRDLVR